MPNCRFSIDGAAWARSGSRKKDALIVIAVAVEQ